MTRVVRVRVIVLLRNLLLATPRTRRATTAKLRAESCETPRKTTRARIISGKGFRFFGGALGGMFRATTYEVLDLGTYPGEA